ncbi:glycosyltransferase family 4 protein [Geothrix sp.]|uniref:glycosyltransferase family 4 protein n=1 Tax=Geothrix sp. TaxID=1962974 RepID=UPI0025BEF9D4|nr:glycosyltransferase family 4 protein [Geothrix sp.]
MRILILSQYFDPEPTFKGLLFAHELMKQGHVVEVLTGFPNYPLGKLYPGYRMKLLQRENLGGIRVTRVPLFPSHDSGGFRRMASYLSFAGTAALMGPWVVRKPDVIYAYHGNATIGVPAWVIGMIRRVPFVLDIQDLWPDSVTSSGMLPAKFQAMIPALEAWCRFLYRRSARIVVLSPGLKRVLMARGVPEEKVEVIPNWCDEIQIQPGSARPEEESLLEGRFNVVMAGNMGRMQGLDVVLEAAQLLQGPAPQVQFVLVGGGVDRPRLEKRMASLGLKNILFLPGRPMDEIGALLHRADALLVHLKDDPLFAITIPSRIQAYLAVGRPLLCGVRGDGAELVKEAGAGFCFEPECPEALAGAVLTVLNLSTEERREIGRRGSEFYKDRLSLSVGTKAFLRFFDRTLSGRSQFS